MIILGCITKYKPEDIKPYVESIEQSGFKGRKVMMVYDIPQETIDYLKSKEWELYQNELQQHIILQRFRDIYKLLEQFPKDETIIWTDVKDVIFQTDPTKWIEKNSNKYFIHLCSEKTDKNLWPSNVSLIPFYKPIENKKFNYEKYKNLDNSTVIFGSPSGVEVWFKNRNKYKKLNYACMGQTTADKIFEYTDDKVIFPKDSTISTLLSLVTESLNEKK